MAGGPQPVSDVLPSWPRADEESESLLPATGTEDASDFNDIEDSSMGYSLSRSQAWNLYTSHMLSTWNARTYEFAAIIFTAATYPESLVAAAIRGIMTTTASICFSSLLGRWIDRNPNRLTTLLTTVFVNRVSVVAACACWFFVTGSGYANLNERAPFASHISSEYEPDELGLWKIGLFAMAVVLGILEKLSGACNTMSMERDWVVVVASPNGQAYDLSRLNAVMRRIDLICKLVAPILTSMLISATASVRIGVIVVGVMSALSCGVEWWCARRVWDNNPRLRQTKSFSRVSGTVESGSTPEVLHTTAHGYGADLLAAMNNWLHDFKSYFSSNVWIPSLSLCLLHLTVLSYSATFITYLLSVGFSLNLITMARAAGSVAEISSTLVTPFGIEYLGKAYHHRRSDVDIDDEVDLQERAPVQANFVTGLERLGLWGIIWQFLNLIPVVLSLWALSPVAGPAITNLFVPSPLLALALFTFLSLSRIGLWIFDLTTQQLTQTLVESTNRSLIAGVETSLASAFELGNYVAVIFLNRPSQFKYLAMGSICAVGLSAAIYAGWVWKMRGHLVHWERLAKGCHCTCSERFGVWRGLG